MLRICILLLMLGTGLSSMAQEPELVLPVGHTGAITDIQISSDKRYMLSRATDNTVKLWNFQTGSLIYTIDNPNIRKVSFSKNGALFLTYGDEHNKEPITVWDTKKIKPVDTIKGSSVKYAHFTPDNTAVIALSYDGISRQEIATQKKTILVAQDTTWTRALHFSKDGTVYYYDYNSATIHKIVLRNAKTNEIIREIPALDTGSGMSLRYFTLSDKNNYMLLDYESGAKSHLEIFNVSANKFQSKFEGYFTGRAPEESISFSPDEKNLYSTEYFKNRLHVWDIASGKELPPVIMKKYDYFLEKGNVDFKDDSEFENEDSTSGISEYLLSPDSRFIMADCGGINIIDIQTKKRLVRRMTLPLASAMRFLNDTTFLMLDDYSKNGLRAYAFPYLKPTQTVFEGKTEETEKQFYDTASNIVTVVTEHYVQFWNVQTQLNIFKKCSFVAINPEHNKALVQKEDRNLYVIDNKTGNDLYQVDLKGFQPDEVTARFSPSGKYIVILGVPDIIITDVQTGNLVKEIPVDNLSSIPLFQISKDDKYIAIPTISDNKAATTICNIQTGEQTIRPVSNIYFSFLDSSNCFLWSKYSGNEAFDGIENVLAVVDFEKNKIKYQKSGIFSYTTNYNNHYLIVSSFDSAKSYMGNYGAKFYPVKTEMINLSKLKKINETEHYDAPFIYFGSSEEFFFTYYNVLKTDSNYHKIKIWDIKAGNQTGIINLDLSPVNSTIYSDKNDKYLVCCTDDNVICIYSLATLKLIRKIAIAEKVQNIEFAANNPQLIVSLGAMTELIDFNPDLSPKENDRLNRMVFSKVDDGQFIQMNNRYYSMDKTLLKDISFRYNNSTVSAEQLDVKYNRPDKVLQAVGNTDTELINAYRKAYEKRIKKHGIDTSEFKEGFNVPEADFANRDNIGYVQTEDKLQLHITGSDTAYTIDRFNVWINESPLFGVRGISLKKQQKRMLDTIITVALSQGENSIEASVTDANGIESYRQPLIVSYTPANPVPERFWFIGIGIDSFADATHNLHWSATDIINLYMAFLGKYGTKLSSHILLDKKVTKENIAATKRLLLDSTAINDKVVVAYSGHGLLSDSFDYYLSTYAVNFHKPEINGLPYDALEDLLDSIPARKKLLLIDACHSGEIDKDELKKIGEAKDALAKKGVEVYNYDTSDVVHIGSKNAFQLMQDLFVNVGRSTGATVISAASGTEFAQESGDLKDGVFTYSILEKLRQGNTVKVSELKDYVSKRVNELTNGLQTPTDRSGTNNYDWEVW